MQQCKWICVAMDEEKHGVVFCAFYENDHDYMTNYSGKKHTARQCDYNLHMPLKTAG